MKRRRLSGSSAVLLIAFASAVTAVGLVPQQSVSNLAPRHQTVVDRWLAVKPALRLATESDCRNKEGLKATRQHNGQSYQPYYAVGDFNRDGQEDFAVALINPRKTARKFAIAIFNGSANSRWSNAPNFLVEGVDLVDGGLVLTPGNRLVAGVFQSDNCVTLRPTGKRYRMKSCL
jgi:hypothetical protein